MRDGKEIDFSSIQMGGTPGMVSFRFRVCLLETAVLESMAKMKRH